MALNIKENKSSNDDDDLILLLHNNRRKKKDNADTAQIHSYTAKACRYKHKTYSVILAHKNIYQTVVSK